MSIEYYVGIEGPTIIVENAQELYDALDILHTQVIDNIGEYSPLLEILSKAMDEISTRDESVNT